VGPPGSGGSVVPEGTLDDGRIVDGGHGPRGGRERPAGVPGDWVRDRKTRQWRPPRRPGPKTRSEDTGGEAPGRGATGADGGWDAERDPEPARLAGGAGGDGGTDPDPLPVTAEVKDDIAGALGLVGLFVLPAAERIDPYCGSELAASWEGIADACTPLIARSPSVVRWMTSAGGLRDWFGLAVALQRPAEAFVRHHITKTVQIVRVGPDGRVLDALQEDDFHEYPAA
jgi:hypothetical protein